MPGNRIPGAFLLEPGKSRGVIMGKLAGAGVLGMLLCFLAAGCSKEAVNQSLYESMRHVSNEKNAENPNYDPDRITDYSQYKAARDIRPEEAGVKKREK